MPLGRKPLAVHYANSSFISGDVGIANNAQIGAFVYSRRPPLHFVCPKRLRMARADYGVGAYGEFFHDICALIERNEALDLHNRQWSHCFVRSISWKTHQSLQPTVYQVGKKDH